MPKPWLPQKRDPMKTITGRRVSSKIISTLCVAAASFWLAQPAPAADLKTTPQKGQAIREASQTNNAAYPVIGYLEKRDRTITIKAGPKGPLYTVKTPDGRTLCEDVTLDQLRAQAPEVHEFLNGAVAGASGTGKRPVVDASIRAPQVR